MLRLHHDKHLPHRGTSPGSQASRFRGSSSITRRNAAAESSFEPASTSRCHGVLLATVVHEELWKLFFQKLYLRQITYFNVGVVGITKSIILVIVLRSIEALQRGNLRDDWPGKNLLFVELRNICSRNLLLLVT